MEGQKEDTAAARGPRPVISSGGDSGITLWHNPNPQSDKHPDFSGVLKVKGQKLGVSGWLIEPGTNGDKKQYGAFVSLRLSRQEGEDYKSVGSGTMNAMNKYDGKPVDEEHRSRVIANVTVDGVEHTVNGYATESLVENQDLGRAIGFTGKVIGPVETEQDQSNTRSGPKP